MEGYIKPKPSVKTISEITGFSPATVSNALNNKRGVKKETSGKIFDVAKQLGYINSLDANRIRFIIYRQPGSDFTESPSLPRVVRGAKSVCDEAGFEIAITYLNIRSISYRQELDDILNDRTHGVIIMGSEVEESEIDKFKEANLPLVLIDYWSNDMELECLINNGKDSVRRIVEYLSGKGHIKIGYLRAEIRSYPFREREESLRENLIKAGCPLSEKYICNVGVCTDSSYESVKQWLAANPELPTAFFADNDIIAMGAIRAMKEAGISLPKDVSIIGFDDIPMSELITPRLTTIRVNMELLGEIAANKIISTIKDPFRPKSKIMLATAFVERDSVDFVGN